MEYKRFGQKIILRLDPGEEVIECIREVCRTRKMALGEVPRLGAAYEVELGVSDTTEKKYYGKFFKGIYEIAFLTGNITQQGRNPYLHLHMVIGSPLVGERHGGHLDRVVISATTEIFIAVIDGTASRRMSESIGLSLIESPQAQYLKRYTDPDCLNRGDGLDLFALPFNWDLEIGWNHDILRKARCTGTRTA